jgi:hypothetical protein
LDIEITSTTTGNKVFGTIREFLMAEFTLKTTIKDSQDSRPTCQTRRERKELRP